MSKPKARTGRTPVIGSANHLRPRQKSQRELRAGLRATLRAERYKIETSSVLDLRDRAIAREQQLDAERRRA